MTFELKKQPVAKLSSDPVIQFKKEEIARFLEAHPAATLSDIFQFIPRTTVAIESGINKSRMTGKVENPNLFRLQEIISISKYLNVPVERIVKLMLSSLPKEVV